MRLFVIALAAAVAMIVAALPPKTGRLVGHVDIGPLHGGPERPGEDKTPSPEVYRRYVAMISQHGPQKGQIKSHMLRLVARLKLSDRGDFAANLQPGEYQVTVEPTGKIGGAEIKEVSIKAGQTVKVLIHVDTGIR